MRVTNRGEEPSPLAPPPRNKLGVTSGFFEAALIDKFGERSLVAELNVSRQALGRALAGLGVRRGTIALMRAGLAAPNIRAKLEDNRHTPPARRST